MLYSWNGNADVFCFCPIGRNNETSFHAYVFAYFSWAVGQFFDKSRIDSYFKALVSYILGMITLGISIAILGAIMDLIIQH